MKYNKKILLIILFFLIFLIFFLIFLNKKDVVDNFETNKKNYLKGIDKIYWINLDRSIERRKNMENIFKDEVFNNIKIERISGIDGKKDNINEIFEKHIANYNNLTINESIPVISCLLSHLIAITTFNNSKNDIALIMEDDMILDYKPYWKKNINDIINNAPSDWEIIMLCYNSHLKEPLTKTYTKAGLNNNPIYCTGAYLINKKGSKKIGDLYKNNKFNLNINIPFAADIYIFTELITYAYKYPYFTYPYENDSTISTGDISDHNFSKRIIEKYIYKINQDDID